MIKQKSREAALIHEYFQISGWNLDGNRAKSYIASKFYELTKIELAEYNKFDLAKKYGVIFEPQPEGLQPGEICNYFTVQGEKIKVALLSRIQDSDTGWLVEVIQQKASIKHGDRFNAHSFNLYRIKNANS